METHSWFLFQWSCRSGSQSDVSDEHTSEWPWEEHNRNPSVLGSEHRALHGFNRLWGHLCWSSARTAVRVFFPPRWQRHTDKLSTPRIPAPCCSKTHLRLCFCCEPVWQVVRAMHCGVSCGHNDSYSCLLLTVHLWASEREALNCKVMGSECSCNLIGDCETNTFFQIQGSTYKFPSHPNLPFP